ncbi:MAG: response regulator [Nostoc sp. TH1S01]|nr:response regulator [Nostoc sp. TH1S01]
MKSSNLVKRKVLIAEDDEDIRDLFSLILEREGWEVNQAKDGKEALEKILEWQPDLLILDYHMPELTGLEVYNYLQLLEIEIVIILMSSHAYLEKIATDVGINYYIRKPCTITQILQTVNLAYTKSKV